jgi:antigen flippase
MASWRLSRSSPPAVSKLAPPAELHRESPYGKAIALVLASGGFIVVGVLRMKFVAVELGTYTVGAFGQASLFQMLVVTLVTAGVVTAGRIQISDGRLTSEQRLCSASRLLLRPSLYASLVLVPGIALSSEVSRLYVGTSQWQSLFALAMAGIVPLVFAQAGMAVVQVLGTRKELSRVAITYVLFGGLSVTLLLRTGDTRLGSASFLAVPAAQAFALILASPTVRKALRAKRSSRDTLRLHAGAVGRASLIGGMLALVADTGVRALLARTHGLSEVALLQPSQLFAVAGFGLITASLTQTMMVDQNLFADRASLTFISGPWSAAIGIAALLGALSVLILLLAPLLIPIFFSPELLPGVAPLALALAAEPLRAVAWVGGSTLLPQGRVTFWLVIQISAFAAQIGVSLLLLERFGAVAVVAGSLVGVVVSVALMVFVMKPQITSRERFLALGLLVVASLTVLAGIHPGRIVTICVVVLSAIFSLGGLHLLRTDSKRLRTDLDPACQSDLSRTVSSGFLTTGERDSNCSS